MSDVTPFLHQFRKDEGDQTHTENYSNHTSSSRNHRSSRSSNSSHHSVISPERPSSTFTAKPILPDDYPKKPQPQASSTRTHRDGNPEGSFSLRHQNSGYGSYSNHSPRPSERHSENMQYSYDEQRYHQNHSSRRSRSPPSTDRYDHHEGAYSHKHYQSASPPMSDRPSYGGMAYSGVDTVEAEAGNILISLANQHTVPPPPMNVTSRPQSYDNSVSRDYEYRSMDTGHHTSSEVEVVAAMQALSNPQSHQPRYPPTPAQSTSSQSTSSKNSSMSIKNLLGEESSATSPVAPSPPQRSMDAQYREYQPYGPNSKSADKDRPFMNLYYSNATKQFDSGSQGPMMVDQNRYNAMGSANASKRSSKRPVPPGGVEEGMAQPSKMSAKDSRGLLDHRISFDCDQVKHRNLSSSSPQDHPASKPKMIHHHSSPSMLPYPRHEKSEGPLSAPPTINGPLGTGSAFHDATHQHKGDDHRGLDYERPRYHHRHPEDPQRRIPVKIEDPAESVSSWSTVDKSRDLGYRSHVRGRDSNSPPRGLHGHPSEQGKPINIKVYNHPPSNERVGYGGPQNPHHWVNEQGAHPHGVDGYVQGKGPYDGPGHMPQPSSGFGPHATNLREGSSAFSRKYFSMVSSYVSMKRMEMLGNHIYSSAFVSISSSLETRPQGETECYARIHYQQQTITPSSSRESYTGPTGSSHPVPSRSRSSSVPMPQQLGPNNPQGAPPYYPPSGVRESREPYQYTAQPLSSSMGFGGHPIYDEK
ncbi:hypothetical protein BC938DRAFT_475663, partial [Jimgerdemannia flammicorona]